ncbi:NlpC/P60 family protein [Alicyclobacillus sp.]|uniref:C40 family peptidase n=1 Tax=Alicyclobacillus sp. TaxID=61169 RepID=UPI0025C1CC19|nr:NlpC/P60 family protein [Alicyclobacillus sp.]MCL6516989.1 C40 family peptidase [Alicyclobacillus sp.]
MSRPVRWTLSLLAAAPWLMPLPAQASTTPATVQYVMTNHGWVSYHSAPKLSSPVTGRLLLNEKALLLAKANAYWYEIQIDGKTAYITTNTNYTHVVTETAAAGTSGTAPASSGTSSAPSGTSSATTSATTNTATTVNPAPSGATTAPSTYDGQPLPANLTPQQRKLLEAAISQIGVPYWWGHQVPGVGFDCSNFTAWCYKQIGISISSSSRTQRYSVGTPVPMTADDKFSHLQPGDLMFFRNSMDPGDGSVGQPTSGGGGHVAIYVGMINGQPWLVQEGGGHGKVTYQPVTGWFLTDFVYARRVLN